VLNEISRVLGPKGRLVINTLPDKWSLAGMVFKRSYNLRTYPEDRMQRMLSAAGFGVAEVNTISGMQVWVAQKP
jgi:hypothetical protein